MSFFSGCFQNFFFVIVLYFYCFQQFDYDMISHGFLCIYAIWDSTCFLNLLFMSFCKFDVLSHYFLKQSFYLFIFFAIELFPFSWDPDYIKVILSQVPVSIFYIHLNANKSKTKNQPNEKTYFCYSDWIILSDLYLSSLTLSSVIFILLLSPF